MSENDFPRRVFLAASGLAPAAAAAQTQTRSPSDPLIIVTTYKFEPHEIEKIKAATNKTKVEIVMCDSREQFRERIRNAEVIYGDIRGGELDFAPRLKWIQAGGAGMEGTLDDKHRASPVVMTNYARTFAHGISETAMGLLLALSRGLVKYYLPQFYKAKTNKPVGTPKSDHHVELVGKTMGIVGMGGIGTMIARRAYYGFDMKIVATDAKAMPKPDFVAELHDPGWLMEMVPKVDVLVAAAPHTKKTEKMFNEAVFSKMKKTAYFLAMSRGALFDDMALVRALKDGQIAGAGLDVFPKEPVPEGHPIFDCDNVILSAHTSGWSPDRQVRLIDLFAENVRRYAEGLPLHNVVDKQAGY